MPTARCAPSQSTSTEAVASKAWRVGSIPALDLRAQCAGFVYAVATADAYIRAGLFRRILVVGQELQSSGMDVSTEGRNTAVIH